MESREINRRWLYRDLVERGASGLTVVEAKRDTTVSKTAIRQALKWLVAEGWARDSGRKRGYFSGRPETIWVATKQAKVVEQMELIK